MACVPERLRRPVGRRSIRVVHAIGLNLASNLSMNGLNATIALVGDYNAESPLHRATTLAIEHSARRLSVDVQAVWLSTGRLRQESDRVGSAGGIWIAPGSPYKDMSAVLDTIRFARESGVPLLGTCGGFQHVIIEFARNVLGIVDAQHAEYDPYASRLFITRLACSLVGRSLPIQLVAGSRTANAYQSTSVTESYYCNFGLNPQYVPDLAGSGLRMVGSDDVGEVRVVELENHPFFVGTLFVPQTSSAPEQPHPLITAFVSAACLATLVQSRSGISG
jgi:CTP synthase (UTP-ammonia lyase)